MELNEDDVLQEVQVDADGEESDEDEVIDHMADMDLDNYDDAEGGAPTRDDAEVVFDKHSGSVFCVRVDPATSGFIVSGGEDDKAYIWKTSNAETVLECTGHKDSVTCVGFSSDSSLVATGDMSGLLKVWSTETRQEIWSFEVSDLEWLEWHPGAPVLLAGTVDGDMWMWKIPAGDCKTFQTHGSSCSVGRVMSDGKRLCSGYADGVVKIWDLKSCSPIHTYAGHMGHTASITCLDCHDNCNLVMSGSTDCTAKLLSSANGKVLTSFNCVTTTPDDGMEDTVEAVGFCKTQNYAATGTLAGMLAVWDIESQTRRHECKHETGIVKLMWDRVAPLLFSCTLDGVVHMWDSRSGKRESQWFGHSEEILDFDISRDGSVLVTGSGDHTARIYSLHVPDR